MYVWCESLGKKRERLGAAKDQAKAPKALKAQAIRPGTDVVAILSLSGKLSNK